MEVFFRELEHDEVKKVAAGAVEKVEMTISDKGLETLASYARNGREAVNMVQIAAGVAITENRKEIYDHELEWIIQSSQLSPRYQKKINEEATIGLVNGLAVTGPNTGSLLEIEVNVIPAVDKGTINVTGIVEEESIGDRSKSIRRKSMAKGSIENVITVLRSMGVPADQYDIHVNFPGGVPVDGPSAGIAMALGIYSAIYRIPIKHTIAVTGEISIHGSVKPVGGVYPKVKGAKLAGATMAIIPYDNQQAMLKEIEGIEVVPVKQLKEVLDLALMKEHVSSPDLAPEQNKKSV